MAAGQSAGTVAGKQGVGLVSNQRNVLIDLDCPPSAGVVKLADAPDSKSGGLNGPCRFDSDLRHQPHLSPVRRLAADSPSRRFAGLHQTSAHVTADLSLLRQETVQNKS